MGTDIRKWVKMDKICVWLTICNGSKWTIFVGDVHKVLHEGIKSAYRKVKVDSNRLVMDLAISL